MHTSVIQCDAIAYDCCLLCSFGLRSHFTLIVSLCERELPVCVCCIYIDLPSLQNQQKHR